MCLSGFSTQLKVVSSLYVCMPFTLRFHILHFDILLKVVCSYFNLSNFPGNIEASEKVANDSSGRIVIWHIAVSLVSGIIFGIPISYVVGRFCRRRKNRNPERSPNGQQKMADAIYQELDLPTLKTESSAYHSMANASSMYETVSDPESTYTKLRKIKDPENVYQSLF